MKLLIISHSCVTPINQQFYAELERQTNWQITIVTPSNWQTEYGQVLSPKSWSDYQGQLLGIPVWLSGNIPLHIYRSIFVRVLKELEPDFIYVHQEPYAIATAQIYLANSLSINKPIAFFTWQNILIRYPIVFRQIEELVYTKSNIAFAGSHSAVEILRKKGYQGNCAILPTGIDTNFYTYCDRAEELKNKLRATENEVIIGYLGRIVAAKGLNTLLQALHLIKSTCGGLTFPEAQPQALAKQLSKLIMNPNLRLSLGKQGRQAVVQNYTNSSLARGFADTIEQVVTAEQK